MKDNSSATSSIGQEISSILSILPSDEQSGKALFHLIENFSTQSVWGNFWNIRAYQSNFGLGDGLTIATNAFSIATKVNFKDKDSIKDIINESLIVLNQKPNSKKVITSFISGLIESINTPEFRRIQAIKELENTEKATNNHIKEREELTKRLGPITKFATNYSGFVNEQTKYFISEALSHPVILKNLSNKVFDFINNPIIGPESQLHLNEILHHTAELLTKPNVQKALIPLINSESIKQIFSLPVVDKDAQQYQHIAVGLVTRQPKECQEFIKSLVSKGPEFTQYVDNVIAYIAAPAAGDDINSDKYKASQKLFEQSNSSLVKLITPKAISSLIPLITEDLAKTIAALPIFQKNSASPSPQSSSLVTPEATKGKKALADKLQAIMTNRPSFPKIPFSSQPPTKNKEANTVMLEFIQELRKSNNYQEIQGSLKKNKENIAQALNVFIGPPPVGTFGEYLHDAGIKGNEIAELLPKIFTKDGIDKLEKCVKDPSIKNIMNLTSHAGITKFIIVKKAGTFIKNKFKNLLNSFKLPTTPSVPKAITKHFNANDFKAQSSNSSHNNATNPNQIPRNNNLRSKTYSVIH